MSYFLIYYHKLRQIFQEGYNGCSESLQVVEMETKIR